jgi:hypothetical protein
MKNNKAKLEQIAVDYSEKLLIKAAMKNNKLKFITINNNNKNK